MAVIRITHENGHSEERSLGVGAYEVGRNAGDIQLGDPNVSARHARIDIHPASATITDLGSSNGTHDATGARIQGQAVMDLNQPFRLGASVLRLVSRETSGGTRLMQQQAPMPIAASSTPAPPQPAAAAAGAFRGVTVPPDWSHLSYKVGNRVVRFLTVTGTVLGSSTHARSYVSGYGGSSGSVSVSTQVVVNREFFLRRDDTGVEDAFQLVDLEVVLRDGQRLTVIEACLDGTRSRLWVRLVHHESEVYYSLNPQRKVAVAMGLARNLGEVVARGFALLMGGVLILGIVANVLFRLPNGEVAGYVAIAMVFLGMPVLSIVYCIASAVKSSEAARKLNAHVDGVARQVLAYVVEQKRSAARQR